MPMLTAPRAIGGMLIALIISIAAARQTGAQEGVKLTIPDSLAARAKVSEPAARKTAQAKVPSGVIQEGELEREKGHLQYSYDVKVPGKSGITEVNVDAISGAVLGVQHEDAASEASESAAKAKPKSP
jgi:uncharacterized membrane protein YkoI